MISSTNLLLQEGPGHPFQVQNAMFVSALLVMDQTSNRWKKTGVDDEFFVRVDV